MSTSGNLEEPLVDKSIQNSGIVTIQGVGRTLPHDVADIRASPLATELLGRLAVSRLERACKSTKV